MVAGADKGSTQTSASRLVAEALVEGHDPSQIVTRAQALGFTQCMTNAVLAACCGEKGNHTNRPIPADAPPLTPDSD